MPLKRTLIKKNKSPALSKLRNQFAFKWLIKQRVKQVNNAIAIEIKDL
ncbi:hypothetical protein N7931_10360 [Catenovulum sp. 2E275]|nr:hypothetical protein [Catenovulum sp. 2E275]MCU4676036.1 hypothetical protein [Catenovulum sp. 2E275]